MIDVVFLLVIFFMVSTTFITFEAGLPVDLPQSQNSLSQTAELPTVTINKMQQVFLGDSSIEEEDLVKALKSQMAILEASVVILRADREVPHGFVVRVMDLIKRSGAERIAIATGG
jgi:biopolymer transport protein ExbD|tara:strand:+ start:5902 stop:6249 length:348 start_codon:yes stop_codon:yes gene_type:complete